MKLDVLFAAIPVADLANSAEWYRQLFGRAHDITVNDDEVMWQITSSGWLYLVADRTRAGHGLVTFAVGDLRATLSEIAARGLRGSPIEAVGDAGSKATFTDPDGNLVMYIEVSRV